MSISASNEFRELLLERMPLPEEQLAALEAHYELLLRWNRVLNLTAIRAVREAVERHYCESLFLAQRLPSGRLRVADIGSGAGFPGFPVAVARPECTVTLIESHQRKAVFLRESSRGMGNVAVAAQRAEDVQDSFDVAISRAVGYAELKGTLSRLAPVVALLTGEEAPPVELGFTWRDGIRLPWGSERFLRLGQRCFT